MTDATAPAKGKVQFIGHAGWKPFALATAIGATGGLAFFMLRMPLAWMMGAAVFCTVAAMSGARVGVPTRLRQIMMVVLGVLLGSGFSPDVVDHFRDWGVSMAVLIVASVASGYVIFALLRFHGGYDARTAYFSASPGGLNEMVTMGAAYGANERVIALIHAVRILTVVMTIPIFYRIMYGAVSSVSQAAGNATDLTVRDVAILVACGVVGAVAARRARMPAAMMFGPMLLSGVVHLAGITQSKPPVEMVAFAQVIIGSALGCRFVGSRFREVVRHLVYGVVAAAILILLAVAFAWLARASTGLPIDSLVLSYAPGGFAEMSLVGLALGADIAMVASHHLFRVFCIVLVGTWVFRRFVDPALPPAADRDD